MQTSEFDFELPPELIAQHPTEPRDQARLMVLRRNKGKVQLEHRTFADLPEYLNPGDLLIRTNSRVLQARLLGEREATGGRWEGLYLASQGQGLWEILATTRGRPQPGEFIRVAEGLRLELIERGAEGRWIVRPTPEGSALELLTRFGQIPLPPYIRKGRADQADLEDYQTTYAAAPGSVAAPTAGLHFTSGLFDKLAERGVQVADVTLHVGVGTFRPIEATSIDLHTMHAEWAQVTPETAAAWHAARAAGKRIVAIGTTSARTLETVAQVSQSGMEPWQGETRIYIRPGHVFQGTDALVTNFHLPKSSLLVLVSALAGVEATREAYAEAIRRHYRFYSYGDAMLVID